MSPRGPTGGPSRGRGPVGRAGQHPDVGGPSADELAADARLVAELARTGCEGRLWELTAHRLAALGIGTLHTLILGGWLEPVSDDLGRPIRMPPERAAALRADDHQRQELVHEAVAKALDLFRRRAVLGGVWTVEGGARLDTYFVNGCVMAMANPVRRWLLSRRDADRTEPWSPDDLDAVRENGTRQHGVHRAADPVDELLDREDTAALVEWLGPVLAKAALLKIHTGWTWAEIAPAVGLSAKALERRLRRFRDRHDPRDLGDFGATDD